MAPEYRIKRAKTGCLTCRIRRVKCDEAKPFCLKCTSTGRKCDGYSSLPFSRKDLQAANQLSAIILSGEHGELAASHTGPVSRLVMDPAFQDVLEKRYFQYFRHKTVAGTNTLLNSHFWDRIVLQACHSEPAIRHAVLALSSLHQARDVELDPDARRSHGAHADAQYHKAIVHARQLIDSTTSTTYDLCRVLTACLIFISYEAVRGEYRASQIHMQSGRAILAANYHRLRGPTATSRSTELHEIQQTLARLDISAIMFQDGASLLEANFSALYDLGHFPVVPAFDTLPEARVALTELTRWILIASSLSSTSTSPDSRQTFLHQKQKCLEQMYIWDAQFALLTANLDPSDVPSVAMMRIWHAAMTAILEAGDEGPESRFDALQHHFAAVVQNAEILLPHVQDSGTFGFDLGYVGAVFLAATRGRDPDIRRRAIAVLRTCPRQEGVWEATGAAALAELWRDTEEQGLENIQSPEDIPEYCRVVMVDVTAHQPSCTARVVVYQNRWDAATGEVVVGMRETTARWERGKTNSPVHSPTPELEPPTIRRRLVHHADLKVVHDESMMMPEVW